MRKPFNHCERLKRYLANNTVILESLLFVPIFAFLCILLKKPLFEGSTTFWHDNLYWNYPVFHLFAESLLKGDIPWWNPFHHAGEPFYPLLLQMRLLEPLSVGTLGFLGLFTGHLPLLFHWHRIVLSLFMAIGIYLYLRPRLQSFHSRSLLQIALCYSSLFLVSFRADAAINHFLWIPYVAIALERIFFATETKSWPWALLGLSLSMNFQSYFFALPCLFLLFFCLGVFLFHRSAFFHVLRQRRFLKRSAIVLMLTIFAALPSVAATLESGDLLFTARLLPEDFADADADTPRLFFAGGEFNESHSLSFSYDAIVYAGSFAKIWDYVQILFPEGNAWIFGEISDIPRHFGAPSEIFIYLGLFPWFLVLLGIFHGKDRLKRLWLFLTAIFLLISLGPAGVLHRILFFLPPFWFLRHLQFATLIVLLGFLNFMILGWNTIEKKEFRFLSPALAVFLGHVAVTAYFVPDRPYFAGKLFWFAVIPLAILGLRGRIPKRGIPTILLAFVFWDLALNFRRADTLYGKASPPDAVLNVSPYAQNLTFFEKRKIAPHYPPISLWGSQRPRYLGNVAREGYLFSRVIREGESWDLWWDGLYVPRDYYAELSQNLHSPELLEKMGVTAPILSSSSAFQYEVERFYAGGLNLKVWMPAAGRIVYADRYHRDWRVFIDDKPAALERAEGIFKAVNVPAGGHRIRFSFIPRIFVGALGLFYLSFLMSLVWLLGARLKK